MNEVDKNTQTILTKQQLYYVDTVQIIKVCAVNNWDKMQPEAFYTIPKIYIINTGSIFL